MLKIQNRCKWLLFVMGLILIGSMVNAEEVWNETYNPPKKFQLIQEMNFRSGPGIQYDKMDVIKKGIVVTVTAMKEGWYEMELPGGGKGYIFKKFLTPVDSQTPSGAKTDG